MTGASTLRPRAGSSAKSILLTLLGELVLPRSGTAWTQSLVDALALLDIEEKNARQALLRLAHQGYIESERVGRRVRWRLTAPGRVLLTSGTERIYSFGLLGPAWDGRWLVVLCSVPERQRAKRHQLRSRLEFAGFGFLGASIAITPHADREALASSVLADLDLVEGAAVFRAEAGDLVPAADLLRRAWDLDALAQRYQEFLRSFPGRVARAPAAELAALVALVHAWRRFPFIDPEIPDELLPAHWVGRKAKGFFDERHARWTPGARLAFEQL
ncbi:MAG TPA: PaaX family transcriptional regulator C-terminal domain-containing protein, partial [Acidimicrobiales bacterium]